MKKYLLALFFALLAQGARAEVTPIQSGASSSASVSTIAYTANGAFAVSTALTTLGACPSGSTVTVTLSGNYPYRVRLNFKAQNASVSRVTASFLRNGAFVSPFTSNNAAPAQATIEAGGQATDLGFDVIMPAPTQGQYSFCPTFATSAGTLVDATGTWTVKPQFSVQEIAY